LCPPDDYKPANDENANRLDWFRVVPFIMMHLACFAVFLVGWSWLAVSIAVGLYALRVFTLTGWYHRYFSHRTFKTWRIVQFAFAVIGCSAVQRGPLWWAAHHRNHHVHSDDEEDLHSPRQHGFWWAHFGWFLTPKGFITHFKMIPDFAKYPELRLLDRFDMVVPLVMALGLYGFGELVALGLGAESGVTGWQLVVWGFFISTIAVYHVTYLVNSATHVIGSRRYETKDDSRNHWLVALLTFGEGWHNNHHYYPNSTRQGFFWWEIDITFYVLKFMSMLGLVWDLKAVPKRILHPQPKPVALPAEVKPATVQTM
jgi:stearoyl-CoA desaturase (delta-9 desaturase)